MWKHSFLLCLAFYLAGSHGVFSYGRSKRSVTLDAAGQSCVDGTTIRIFKGGDEHDVPLRDVLKELEDVPTVFIFPGIDMLKKTAPKEYGQNLIDQYKDAYLDLGSYDIFGFELPYDESNYEDCSQVVGRYLGDLVEEVVPNHLEVIGNSYGNLVVSGLSEYIWENTIIFGVDEPKYSAAYKYRYLTRESGKVVTIITRDYHTPHYGHRNFIIGEAEDLNIWLETDIRFSNIPVIDRASGVFCSSFVDFKERRCCGLPRSVIYNLDEKPWGDYFFNQTLPQYKNDTKA